MKILLAVDGSDFTRKMLDYVGSNTSLFDASHEYTVFTAPLALPAHASSVVGSNNTQDYYQDEAAKVLGPAVAALQARGLTATGAWKAGHAGDVIASFAQQGGYQLIVMGSHGHGALGRLVMGSVANEVVSQCKVPVLLVR
jgi:nucleotide-binding universal stress UspA family protein